MSKFFVLYLALTIFWSFMYGQEYKQYDYPENKLVVEGVATLEYDADIVTLSLSLHDYNSSLEKANDNLDNKLKQMINDLVDIGIDRKDISVRSSNSRESYEKKLLSSSKDFRAMLQSAIVVRNLDILEQVLTIINSIKDVYINDTDYSLSNEPQVKDEVMAASINAAKEKAVKIEMQLGLKLGGVSFCKIGEIEEVEPEVRFGSGYSNVVISTNSKSELKTNVSDYSSRIKVTGSVIIVYHIDNN